MNILIIDDHELFAEGLKYLLLGIRENLNSTSDDNYLNWIEPSTDPIDLILLDYHLPGTDSQVVLTQLKQAHPETPIVIISGEESRAIIHQSIAHGAAGFIPKSSSQEVMIHALQLVLSGGVYLPIQAFDKRLDGSAESSKPAKPKLTFRQAEVVSLAIRGVPNKLIADRLEIAEGTVKAHLFAAYQILDVHNRTEAVFAAARLGFNIKELEPDSDIE